MSRSRHTEAQIIAALKQVEAGRTVEDVAREQGVSKHTIYAWKSKYGGMEVSEAEEVKHPANIREVNLHGHNSTLLFGRRPSGQKGFSGRVVALARAAGDPPGFGDLGFPFIDGLRLEEPACIRRHEPPLPAEKF